MQGTVTFQRLLLKLSLSTYRSIKDGSKRYNKAQIRHLCIRPCTPIGESAQLFCRNRHLTHKPSIEAQNSCKKKTFQNFNLYLSETKYKKIWLIMIQQLELSQKRAKTKTGRTNNNSQDRKSTDFLSKNKPTNIESRFLQEITDSVISVEEIQPSIDRRLKIGSTLSIHRRMDMKRIGIKQFIQMNQMFDEVTVELEPVL